MLKNKGILYGRQYLEKGLASSIKNYVHDRLANQYKVRRRTSIKEKAGRKALRHKKELAQ